jgi:lysophospholipase L1-like esterase
MARFRGSAMDFILHYTVTIKHSSIERLTAVACIALCALSVWLALLSYRYARFSSRYLGTPSHALHRGPEDCLVIFDGDSLTAGDGLSSEAETYPFKAMAASGHACTWENLAVSGAFTEDRLASQAVLASYARRLGPRIYVLPRVYVLWIGSNDLMYRPEPVGDVWQRVRPAMLGASKNGWGVEITTVTPRVQALRPDQEIEMLVSGLFGPHSFESRRVVFNNLIRENAARDKFRIIDFAGHPEIGRPDSMRSQYYFPDRTHFSPSGTDVLAGVAAPVLRAMLVSGR